MENKYINETKKHTCLLCGENNFTEEGLPLHMLYTHGGGIRCQLCDHCSLTHTDAQDHLEFSHKMFNKNSNFTDYDNENLKSNNNIPNKKRDSSSGSSSSSNSSKSGDSSSNSSSSSNSIKRKHMLNTNLNNNKKMKNNEMSDNDDFDCNKSKSVQSGGGKTNTKLEPTQNSLNETNSGKNMGISNSSSSRKNNDGAGNIGGVVHDNSNAVEDAMKSDRNIDLVNGSEKKKLGGNDNGVKKTIDKDIQDLSSNDNTYTNPKDMKNPSDKGVLDNDSQAMAANNVTNECPMCGSEFENVTVLQDHVNCHFDQDMSLTSNHHDLTTVNPTLNTTEFSQMLLPPTTNSIDFQNISSMWKDNFKSCSADVTNQFKEFYISSKITKSYWLAENCCHFSSNRMEDERYGCGYRNLQMILSCLSQIDEYKTSIFQGYPVIPSVKKLQALLEQAWTHGFDAEGGNQLNRHVFSTDKWIGASDVAALLSFLKVKCVLYDFSTESNARIKHPLLSTCIKHYFSGNAPYKIPVFLQYQGHSLTVVGVLEDDDGSDKLIVIDPSVSKAKMQYLLNKINHATKYNKSLNSTGSLTTSKSLVELINDKKDLGSKSDVGLKKKQADSLSNKTGQNKGIINNKNVSSKRNYLDKEMSEFLFEPWRFNKNQYQLITVIGLIQNDSDWEKSKILSSVRVS